MFGQIEIDPDDIDFGGVTVGTTTSATLQVTSQIAQTVTLTGQSAPFTIAPESIVLGANESTNVTISFSPSATGNFSQTIASIFLPTTHGTASEVTMWGTVWNMKEKKKYSISHPDLYPGVAILDGNLTLSLPLNISIMTVMDALSHSFESIWNKNANPTSTDFAISAICSILDNGEALKENPTDLAIRNNLLKAATVAGLAFSNTATAAAHSMSYPLTIHYGIPHGIASSISLIPLLEKNAEFITIFSNLIKLILIK